MRDKNARCEMQDEEMRDARIKKATCEIKMQDARYKMRDVRSKMRDAR